jgi:hypothetical protein
MKTAVLFSGIAISILFVSPLLAQEKKDDDGFVPMFNGKDLTGWVNVNCHPDTFFVKDQMIITTGKPTGFMRTEKQYENFIAEFEWFHVNTKEIGNSGFFVWADPIPAVGSPYTRGIEVQVLVNFEKDWATSHGDLFSIWGATCKPDRPHPKGYQRCLPSERRCKGGGEWNHYKVIANNGAIKLHVNGKEVSGVSECNPRKGYLALESEGAECRFRNLKIKELPSTNPKKEEIADEDKGFKNLYTGLDLKNWKETEAIKKHWKPMDWQLHHDGEGDTLVLEKKLGDFELIVDWNIGVKMIPPNTPPNTSSIMLTEDAQKRVYLGQQQDGKINIVERKMTELRGEATTSAIATLAKRGEWNRTSISRKGERTSITINGKTILERINLPDPARIGLGTSLGGDFANIFIRELK